MHYNYRPDTFQIKPISSISLAFVSIDRACLLINTRSWLGQLNDSFNFLIRETKCCEVNLHKAGLAGGPVALKSVSVI